MTDIATPARRAAPSWLYAAVVFMSAALVFMVEPMVGRLVLPILGGSAAVWNTSLAFFQGALLVGYIYAHALQTIPSLRTQILVHLGVLAAAALALPLAVSPLAGEPDPSRPALWLMGALLLSVGAPFAALSATAPLVQAWHARVDPDGEGGGPWGLYAASNLGSLLALLAYPTVVEPLITLRRQSLDWSAGYVAFIALLAVLGAALWRSHGRAAHPPIARGASVSWIERGRWVILAAIPSSLMLGVTSYVTTDVGSAPFLWVAPLALYLGTFIIAFQARPAVRPAFALTVQAGAVLLACVLVQPLPNTFMLGLVIHFVCFFFTALICHQALVARRPATGRLTDFYICMSLGGVVGGAFNAFLAPVLFTTIVEYPAVLILACLARPWGPGPWLRPWRLALLAACAAAVVAANLVAHPAGAGLSAWTAHLGPGAQGLLVVGLLAVGGLFAAPLSGRAVLFAAAAAMIAFGGSRASDRVDVVHHWRGFFGVLRESRLFDPRLGGEVRMLSHGNTLHGAEAIAPAYRCQPLLYYAHETPIGQVFDAEHRARPRLEVGAVGLGAGSVATYDHAGDHMTFFEIDPLVLKVSSDPANFGYLSGCARGGLDYRLGDARLTLGHVPDGSFDVLLIDAFSSDSVPAHLLTVEAARLYLSKVKADGVVVMHLSNRNLDLINPAQAVAEAAGAHALFQAHNADPRLPTMWEASEDALVMSRTQAGLAPFLADRRWRAPDAHGVKPWTDDYTNVFGALVRRLQDRTARR